MMMHFKVSELDKINNNIIIIMRTHMLIFFNPHSRLHQMAKLFLFAPSSGLYSCPLAMTDGAAKLIEVRETI